MFVLPYKEITARLNCIKTERERIENLHKSQSESDLYGLRRISTSYPDSFSSVLWRSAALNRLFTHQLAGPLISPALVYPPPTQSEKNFSSDTSFCLRVPALSCWQNELICRNVEVDLLDELKPNSAVSRLPSGRAQECTSANCPNSSLPCPSKTSFLFPAFFLWWMFSSLGFATFPELDVTVLFGRDHRRAPSWQPQTN